MAAPQNILFVCTGNSCRSVMAEGLFRKLASDRPGQFSVSSAGISAMDGFAATEETIRVLRDEEGVDMTGHRSRRLTSEMIRRADRIFVMERVHRDVIVRAVPEAASKVALLAEYAPEGGGRQWPMDIPDPIRMSENFYRNVLSVIRDCLKQILDEYRKEG